MDNVKCRLYEDIASDVQDLKCGGIIYGFEKMVLFVNEPVQEAMLTISSTPGKPVTMARHPIGLGADMKWIDEYKKNLKKFDFIHCTDDEVSKFREIVEKIKGKDKAQGAIMWFWNIFKRNTIVFSDDTMTVYGGEVSFSKIPMGVKDEKMMSSRLSTEFLMPNQSGMLNKIFQQQGVDEVETNVFDVCLKEGDLVKSLAAKEEIFSLFKDLRLQSVTHIGKTFLCNDIMLLKDLKKDYLTVIRSYHGQEVVSKTNMPNTVVDEYFRGRLERIMLLGFDEGPVLRSEVTLNEEGKTMYSVTDETMLPDFTTILQMFQKHTIVRVNDMTLVVFSNKASFSNPNIK